MARVTLHVLDEPLAVDAKVVVSMRSSSQAALSGGGRTTLLCGACGFRIARRIDPAAVVGLVLQCPRCCKHNVAAPA